jgi:hypothetical protein
MYKSLAANLRSRHCDFVIGIRSQYSGQCKQLAGDRGTTIRQPLVALWWSNHAFSSRHYVISNMQLDFALCQPHQVTRVFTCMLTDMYISQTARCEISAASPNVLYNKRIKNLCRHVTMIIQLAIRHSINNGSITVNHESCVRVAATSHRSI